MGMLEGKKLLVLGTSVGSVEIVKFARSQGAYVIVTDYLPPEKSEAKRYANESVMISTLDVKALCDFGREQKIDGIFSGVSEDNLCSMRAVAEELNLPCYFTRKQWDVFQNKDAFKKLCREYGVPTPEDYSEEIREKGIDGAEITFPVIVKPVDSSAGRGIRTVHTKEELKEAYEFALSYSPGKTVLVEEHMSGVEVTATYTFKDGEVSLSCLKDKFLSEDHPGITSQVDVLLAPSRDLPSYMKEINEKVIAMLKGAGATNGVAFFQGISTPNGIKFFESGYRINGGSDYRLIAAENGINYLEMMTAHALTGKMEGHDLSEDNPFFRNIALTFNLYVHGGTIGTLSGCEKIRELPNVRVAEYLHREGDEIVENHTLNQRAFRAVIRDDSVERIKETIKTIYKEVQVLDENGRDMRYKPFDTARLDPYKEVLKERK